MSEYDRLVIRLEELCKFCPVCGKELILHKKIVPESSRHGISMSAYSVDLKKCPDDCCIFWPQSSWDLTDKYPDAVFDLDEDLFVPEHLRQEGAHE